MGTHRRRQPQGRSWPLRPAQVAELLAELGAPQPSYISAWGTARTVYVTLSASWRPEPGPHSSAWEGGDEHVWVSFNSAPSEVRAEVERAMLVEAVPALADWLRRAAQAPEGWKIMRHRWTWTWRHGEVTVSGDDLPCGASVADRDRRPARPQPMVPPRTSAIASATRSAEFSTALR